MADTYTTPRTLTITLKDPSGQPVEGAVSYIRLVRGITTENSLGTFPTAVIDGDFVVLGEVEVPVTDVLGVTTVALVPSLLLSNVFYIFYVKHETFSYACAFRYAGPRFKTGGFISYGRTNYRRRKRRWR